MTDTTTKPIGADEELYKRMNEEVATKLKYKRGLDGWQMDELQDGQEGDCDSFSYTLAKRLEKQGVDLGKMALVTYRMDNGQDHAVLRVKKDDGKYLYLDPAFKRTMDKIDGTNEFPFMPGQWGMLRKLGGKVV